MARARNIKPGFYRNEDLAECSVWARYIFPGLWMLADREGRLEDRPKRIKGDLLPFDSIEIDPLLSELQQRGFLVRYENSDGRFIQISKFSTHQSPHYSEKASTIKPPQLPENSRPISPEIPGLHRESSEKKGVIKSGPQPPDSLNPDSPILRLSDSPNPESGVTLPPSAAAGAAPGAEKPNRGNGKAKPEPPTRETWACYSVAYRERYGVEPMRNAKVNGMISRFCQRIPLAEAPQVAAFYVRSNRGLYVSAKHAVDLLLRDAEGLRTEWATGQHGTETQARMADQTAAAGAVWGKLIAESEAGKP